MYKKSLIIISIILIVLTTIAYSGLSTSLAITGEATIRAVSDIRVKDIKFNNATNGAVEQYNSKYTKNTITTGFKSQNNNSSISYIVTITNNGDIDEAIYDISTISNNNGIHVLIDGEEINSKLPIIVPYKTSKEIIVMYTASNPSNEVINTITTFDFREVYYITYDTKGGSFVNTQTKFQNENINITNEVPTKTGYIFLSWNDKSDGTGISYSPNDLYTLNSNKTLYAQYKSGTYEISLDNQNATTSGTSSIYEKYNVGYYLDSTAQNEMTTNENGITIPVKDGYTFDGYYTALNGEGTKYIDENGKLTNLADTTYFSYTDSLYAKWTANTLTIKYYAGGAQKNGNTTLSNQLLVTDIFNYNGEDLKTNGLKNYDSVSGTWNLNKTGYTSTKYWHLGTNSSTTKVHEDTTFSTIQLLADAFGKLNDFKLGNVTLNIYAGWEANKYTVVYNGNGSTSGSMVNSVHTYDVAKTLTTNSYVRTGYTFIGWNTKADGNGTAYLNNQEVTNLIDVNNGLFNIYAQWKANTYTIIFNKNNNSATGTMNNQSFTYDASQSLSTNTFKLTGYKFIGWNTESNGTGTMYSDGQSVSNLASSGSKTLYAIWQRVMAENVEHTESELNCTDAQCVIDELHYMLY